jgi:hypothetical protein
MTYGRPSMTSHLSSVPLPGGALALSPLCETRNPSLMDFYIATIELYQILDRILSDVYNAWRGRSNNALVGSLHTTRQAGLDVVIELEEKLFEYESGLPSSLSWTRPPMSAVDPSDQLILDRQRNVLHARYALITAVGAVHAECYRFLYLRLLLYRPIFTRLCSETSTHNAPDNTDNGRHSSLYSSMLSKCAAACARAAIDLTSLVYDTYQTSSTDTWWYNGFCISLPPPNLSPSSD